MTSVIFLMVIVSITLGCIALFALLWGIKTKQFEDYTKFLDGTKFDSEEALNDAYKMEQKKKNALKNKSGYRPPD
ncbi:cbb3-type cytochrome oxidase assembly protein CcoS [Campylobacter sp. FMV-PI01]|uniref:Cbb3-type cytochrome oxidase assembly protein CcoS n=1 Tax=Campylobacter portucalensis TaxID=2608384 RepID=A0A6L5WF96_9BACT|nr:cbb3-type cytochrome oxidase assembly protein CcoS [Campylobacter portucalensis]MSN95670.1 cbb3-type cytochrome oxidase assembly protein CcoS [Campylobacter portucalensis]